MNGNRAQRNAHIRTLISVISAGFVLTSCRINYDSQADEAGCCAFASAYSTEPQRSTCGGGGEDLAQLSFETNVDGWAVVDPANELPEGAASLSSTRVFAGSASLQATVTVPANSATYVRIRTPTMPPGGTVTFHVWVPEGAPLVSLQPYVMDAGFVWSGSWIPSGEFSYGCWNTVTVPVPATFVTPLFEAGVELRAGNTGWNGTIYVDSVSW